VTVAAHLNAPPVSVSIVPPAAGPEGGVTDVMLGRQHQLNAIGSEPLWPSGLMTVTGTPLIEPAGVVARSDVALTNITLVGIKPRR